mgnify:CR=1 FL=1
MTEKKLTFWGRKIDTKEKIKGFGVKEVDNNFILICDDGEHIITPSSLTIFRDNDNIPYSKQVMTVEQINELHHTIVQTIIDYCKNKNIKDVEEVHFGVDCLQNSIDFGEWTPCTDSSLSIYGYENNEKKIIGESY